MRAGVLMIPLQERRDVLCNLVEKKKKSARLSIGKRLKCAEKKKGQYPKTAHR